MKYLTNYPSINELFNETESFNSSMAIEVLSKISILLKKETGVLNNKSQEEISKSKDLSERQTLRNEIQEYRENFNKELIRKIENNLYNAFNGYKDYSTPEWINELTKFYMQTHNIDLNKAREKSFEKVLSCAESLCQSEGIINKKELIEDFKSSAIKYDNLIEKIYQRMEKNSNKVLSY